MRKIRNLTLFEIVIAISLSGILLGTLFRSFVQVAHLRHLAQTQEILLLQTSSCEMRISKLLPHLSAERDKKNFLFHTQPRAKAQGRALHFAARAAIDRDPDLSDLLEYDLFLSKEGDLCLASSKPSKKEQIEVLLKGVKTLEYSFFDPKTCAWSSSWEKKKESPPFFKMKWSWKESSTPPHETVFFLEPKYPIIYS